MHLPALLSQLVDSADPRRAILLIFVISILITGGFLLSLIAKSGWGPLDSASQLSLALTGGTTLLILLSLPIFYWAARYNPDMNFSAAFLTLALGLVSATLALNLPRLARPRSGSLTLILLTCMLIGLAFIRLNFIRGLQLPPYSDSVEHYQITYDLLHPERPPQNFYTISHMPPHFYHFGFHSLAGWVAALSNAPIAQVILVLGQLLQILIAISIFFPVRAITDSAAAGLFSVLLAGLAWRMPAFASNWGKYPALTGIVTFIFAVSMLQWAAPLVTRKKTLLTLVLVTACGLISLQAHARSLLLLALAMFSWFAAAAVTKSGPRWLAALTVACIALVILITIRISAHPVLVPLLTPYWGTGSLSTWIVISLAPFGFLHLPRQMLSALIFLDLILLCTLIPLPALTEQFGSATLIDRPFAQMSLFLPLSLAGGIGLEGLRQTLTRPRFEPARNLLRERLWLVLLIVISLEVAGNAFRHHDFSPSTCCQLAANDDLLAIAWIQDNLPASAVILIASNQAPNRRYGVDGGIWITPLTGYLTEKWPYNSPMDSPENLAQICAKGTTHVYAGGNSSRFSVETMENQPRWFKNLLTLPGAYIYEMVGCSATRD